MTQLLQISYVLHTELHRAFFRSTVNFFYYHAYISSKLEMKIMHI